MKCPRCGANLPNGATSCGSCGARFSLGKRCPHCQAVIPSQAAVCPKCGKPVAVAAAPNTPQKPAKQKNKPKGAFRWWQIPIAILIFLAGVGVGAASSSSSTTPTKDKAKTSSVDKSNLSSQMSLDELAKSIKDVLDQNYSGSEVAYDDKTIQVTVWIDGIAAAVGTYQQEGIGADDENWVAAKNSTLDMANSLQETVNAAGYSDMDVAVNFANDQNRENTLLSILNGEVVYDVLADQSNTPPAVSNVPFKVGETWTVDGQWELTVTGVRATDDRNEFSDKTPGAVYIVDYTYKNIGYKSDIMDGLFISLDDMIVDNAGKMGYSYPNTVPNVPKETPVGATCDAQVCIGVENPGSFTLSITQLDGNREKQSATFEVEVK